MAVEASQNDIPVWFNGTQRWMTGLTKRTTCDDVIYALLVSTGLHETESTDNFAIFEKWREVERPLSARTKLLKVWSSWGEEQSNVQMSMRSLNDYFLPGESSLYMRSRRRHKRSNRNRERHTRQCKCHNQRDYSDNYRLRTMEHLVKLVVGQERQIQDLNDRIYDTDRLIDKHEARIHLNRVQQNGHDYVQNSYLNNHSSQTSSSSSADSSNFTNIGIKDFKVIFRESSSKELEEIVHVCNNLTHVDRRILHEEEKIKEMIREIEKLVEVTGVGAEMEAEADVELEEARVEMIRAVTTYVTNEYNERELDRKIDICLGDLTSRTEYMKQISQELCDTDNMVSKNSCQDTFISSYHNNSEVNNSKNQHICQPYSLPVHAQQITRADNQNIQSDSWQVSNHGNRLNYEQHRPPIGSMTFYNQCSARSVGNVQTGIDIPVQFSNTESSSVPGRSLIPDKDRGNVQHLKTALMYSDHVFEPPTSRESRAVYRSKDTQHQGLYSRSRSAERSLSENREYQSVVEKCEAASNSEGIYDKFGQSRDQTRSAERKSSVRAIIDQYGLELGTSLSGYDPQHSCKHNSSFLPSNICPEVSSTKSEIESKYQLKCGVSASTDRELEYRGEKQQSHEWRNYTYCDGENNHPKNGCQLFSANYSSESRTSVNKLDREKKEGSRALILCTSDDRSIFEENSDLSRIKSCTTGGIHRQASNNEDRKPPNSNSRIDLVNERDIHQPRVHTFTTYEPEYHDTLFNTRLSSSVNSNCFEKNIETNNKSGANYLQESVISSHVIKSEPTQIGRQTLIGDKKRDGFRKLEHSKQNDMNNGLICQKSDCVTSNNGMKYSLYSPRRQGISLSQNSNRSLQDKGPVITSSRVILDASERCGLCIKKESTVCVHNTDSINHSHSGTTGQHNLESRFNIDTADGYSNKSGDVYSLRERTANKSILTPELNSEITSSPSNMVTVNLDTNRGALYHIVSNKMNKSKSESINNHQNVKRECTALDSSTKKRLTNRPPNIDRTNSTDVDSGIYNDTCGSQSTHGYNNRKLINSPSTFSCDSEEQHNSPSTFSCDSEEQHNSPSTFSYDNLHQHDSPFSFICKKEYPNCSPSTLSCNSGAQNNSPSSFNCNSKERHHNSLTTFSYNNPDQQNSPSSVSCNNREHRNNPSTFSYNNQNSPTVNCNNKELHNSPTTFSYNNPNQQNIQSSVICNNREHHINPTTFSYNNPDQQKSQSVSCNNKEHHNSPTSFSYNNPNQQNSPSSFSYINRGHYNSPSTLSYNNEDYNNITSTFSYNNTGQPDSKPTHVFPIKKHISNSVSMGPYSEDKTGSNTFNQTKSLKEKPNGLRKIIDRPTYDITRETQTSNHGNTNYNCVNRSNNHSITPLSPSTIFQNSINQKIGVSSRDLIHPVLTKNITYSSGDFYSRSHDNSNNDNITKQNLRVEVKTKLDDINDSNSDTGLSSMHSDETQNLETLV